MVILSKSTPARKKPPPHSLYKFYAPHYNTEDTAALRTYHFLLRFDSGSHVLNILI